MTSASRTLPIRLQPLPGEALDSWLEALAERLKTPLEEVLSQLGLPKQAGQASLSQDAPLSWVTVLRPDDAARIAFASGLHPQQISRMTLAHFHNRALLMEEHRPRVNRHVLWGRGSGSRYCPGCLDDTAGRWQTTWRLGWSFACPRHQRLLADSCPRCRRTPRERPHHLHEVPRPGHCTTLLDRGRRARCDHPFAATTTLPLPTGHPALAAQQLILEAIESGAPAFGVYAISPQPVTAVLSDIRALASCILADAGATALSHLIPDDLAQAHLTALPGHRATPKKRPGFMAPPSAASTAAAVTAAMQILRQPDIQQAGSALRSLFNEIKNEQQSATSPGTPQIWGKDISPFLHAVCLAAHGPSMRPSLQLRHRTITEFPRRATSGSEQTALRARKIPTMLWPAWTIRLTPAAGVSHTVLQSVLASALLLIGSRTERDEAAAELGSATDKVNVSRVLEVLRDGPTWPDIQRAMDRLVTYLDSHETPIDYRRRRQLDYSGLLPDDEWLRICRHTKAMAGNGRRQRVVRAIVFQRISGLPFTADPANADITDDHFRHQITTFPITQNPELARALRQGAHEFLAQHGIRDEPVSWQPPLRLLDGLDLPGPDPARIDLVRLHELIRGEKHSLQRAAEALSTSLDAVRHTLDEHPAPGLPMDSLRLLRAAARESIPAEEFRRLYVDEHLSLDRISQLTGFSRGTLTALAGEYEAPLRPAHGYAHHEPVDRDWLFEQYVLRQRPLSDLAQEKGMSKANMRRWARIHKLPMRPSGGASHADALRNAESVERAPAILQPVLTSAYARQRLRRFARATGYSTIREAADGLGISQSTLSSQIRRLEQDLGGALLERAKRSNSMKLTELGRAVAAAVPKTMMDDHSGTAR
ncbi:TniQ family protein [Kitasatospora sp. NPDC048722]|uniref:TniQ family protein n=1 Tax=Kitasatospora sp. NPDC048722 TaxID=3155639 RepID=UPI0033EEEFA2